MDFKSLDDIFADPAFDDLVAELQPKKVSTYDRDLENFREILNWIYENGHEPKETRNPKERQLSVRLNKFRKDKELKTKLKPYDSKNLLGALEEKSYEIPDSLDDILADDDLFGNVESDSSIFDLSRYKRTINAADKIATRKRVKRDFSQYDKQFKEVHKDISAGLRQVKPFKLEDSRNEQKIVKGNYYIDNGVLLYVKSIYDEETGEEFSESKNRKHKVHTIYENGTENHIWLLSLVSSLYDKKRQGRRVTEKNTDLLGDSLQEFHTTGYIYVVRYAGNDESIHRIKNLYKIGRATDVASRLANTVNEPTYLFAPVKLVAEFEIQNISVSAVENYLHHTFASKRVVLTSQSPTGESVEATEWFIAPFEEIQEEINQICTKLAEN